ncbi:uncharacterized protein [Pyrus communis]|uniref:uncharacterized protein n=1 Tax=Pyrus communis TaxID=23211 RepID=UPI0035C0F6E5
MAVSLASIVPVSSLVSEDLLVGLFGLAELYNCIEELVLSPVTQQALRHQQCKAIVEEALDGSVGLLDSCGSARDILLTMKEHVQNIQSALRRRTGDIETTVHSCICFRKKAKKSIAKSLRELKIMETDLGSFHLLDCDHGVLIVLKLLRELSDQQKKAKRFTKVGSVDVALCSLHGNIRRSDAKIDVLVVQWRLDTLDCSISSLDAGLEIFFRYLLQHRVSLLKVLTP